MFKFRSQELVEGQLSDVMRTIPSRVKWHSFSRVSVEWQNLHCALQFSTEQNRAPLAALPKPPRGQNPSSSVSHYNECPEPKCAPCHFLPPRVRRPPPVCHLKSLWKQLIMSFLSFCVPRLNNPILSYYLPSSRDHPGLLSFCGCINPS